MCCGGIIRRQPCCNNSDCKHCVSGNPEPCLHKAINYQELMECSGTRVKVDDPDTEPQPNGCSVPPIICGPGDCNNPAWTWCGDASSFLEPCNIHDTRYQTCGFAGFSQILADYEFSENLDKVCAPLSGDCKDSCNYWAGIYAGAVVSGGRPSWEDDQVKACTCCDCFQ